MQIVATDAAPRAIGPYSQGVVAGELVFLSGQIALTPSGEFLEGDITAQTTQVLENLKAILAAAGSDLSCVVKTSVFLAEMGDFSAMNAVYEGYFGAHKPARSTICVKSLPKNALVEIECVALKKH